MKLCSVLLCCFALTVVAPLAFAQASSTQSAEPNQTSPNPQRRMPGNRDARKRGEKIRHRLAQLDTDQDQRISRDEWKRRPKAFDRLDSNHDGFITREEMKALREQRRKRNNANENKPPAN